MILNITDEERLLFNQISDIAAEMGINAYAVGGYVRDRLLNRPTKDIDIVAVGNGIELAQKLAKQMKPSPNVVIYKRFGTAMLRYKNLDIEFVGARKESYNFNSRKPDVQAGTLAEDQARRDFTINALAISLNKNDFGTILDPFDGLHHLEERLLITPLDPGVTFSDDPLRMLRAIRFATQLNFHIDPDTFAAINQHKDRIKIISQERITTELTKILAASKPSIGYKLLFESGLLKIIFPELNALQGIEVQEGRGHKDNFFHTLQVVDQLTPHTDNIWLRWATLLHDIGKAPTKRFSSSEGWTFHGHDAIGAAMIPRLFKKLRLPLDEKMRYVQKLVALHQRPISLTKEEITDSALRRLLFDAGDDIDDLMLLCRADITSKNENKVRQYLKNYEVLQQKLAVVEENDRMRYWQPPITGEVIMSTFNIPPSKTVGIIKDFIRESILDGDIPNQYDAAYQLMMMKGKELGLEVPIK